MRVAHAIWSLDMGGSESMLVDIVNQQVRAAEVSVIVGNRVVSSELLGAIHRDVKVACVGRPPGSRNPWYLLRLNRLLWSMRPDIIHAHRESLIEAVYAPFAKKVLTVHDTRLEESGAINRYDRVFSISHALADQLLTGPFHVRSHVVHNGIDFSAIRQRTWVAGAPPFRIVQVSRLAQDKKGQDVLLRALRIVLDALGAGSVTLDLIGDGPDREALESLVGSLGLSASCRFLGSVPRGQVYEMLPGYDLLVQPSRWEGFGLTVVEGIAAGLPVLASDLEGPREILENGRYGYLFAAAHSDDCARQVMRIIAASREPGFAARLTANRNALMGRFGIDVTASSYLSEYESLLADR